ncbi:hypothetical protein [Pseudomonas frederiksbergensis]|uniref:hypothetical protein n=1 Tax=Pseudomonas frederiksbergensis TaxID=104087 RepID=UPI003D243C93
MKVETEYLPDPRHEYTIDTKSFLSNYTSEINRSEKGFLEVVTFNSDSTAIAKQLVTSQTNLRTAEVDARAAETKTKAAEEKTATDKQKTELTAAENAQKAAQLAVQIAQAKLELLQSLEGQPNAPTNLKEQILAARIGLSEAMVRLDVAQMAYTAVSTDLKAANAPPEHGKTLIAPEPVFLKIDMTKDSVKLVPAFAQQNRETWKIPTMAISTSDLQFVPASQVVRPAEKTGALTATVQSTVSIRSVSLVSIHDLATGRELTLSPSEKPYTAILFDRSTMKIDLAKNTAAGEYSLTYKVDAGSKDKPDLKSQVIRLRVER